MSDENKQKKIYIDKSGKGKHRVEDDPHADSTKPPTDSKKKSS